MYDCNKSPVSGVGRSENYLCHVISDVSGKFKFPCVATGEYSLVSMSKLQKLDGCLPHPLFHPASRMTVNILIIWPPGTDCSKLMLSFFNVLLKFQTLNISNKSIILLKMFEQLKNFSKIFSKKYQCIWSKQHLTNLLS